MNFQSVFFSRRNCSAFTLLELTGILVFLLLLAPIAVTGLCKSRLTASGFGCMNNQRQMVKAWRMYADDNCGRLVPNKDVGGGSASSPAWVAGWLDYRTPDNTNTAMLIDHRKYPYGAYLGPYINSASPFRCPADRFVCQLSKRLRVRSFAMNNFFGEASRTWGISRFLMFTNMNQIKSPSRLWLFIDEHEQSINDGWYATSPDAPDLVVDYPAAYHGYGAGISFVDGHADIQRWTDPRTVPALTVDQPLPLGIYISGNPDLYWLKDHATEPK